MMHKRLVSVALAACCFASIVSAGVTRPDEVATTSGNSRERNGDYVAITIFDDDEEAPEAAATTTETGGSSSVEEQIKTIGDEIFAGSPTNSLSYEDMLERLQKLKELLEQVPAAAGNGHEQREEEKTRDDVVKVVAALYEARHFAPEQDASCPEDAVKKVVRLKEYIEQFRAYGPNARSFLEHLIRKILAECGEEAESLAAAELDPGDRDLLRQVDEIVHEALESNRAEDGSPARGAVLFGYLYEHVMANGGDVTSSDERYRNTVESPCRGVLLYLEGPTEVIRHCPAPEHLDAVDDEAIELANVYETCIMLDYERRQLRAALNNQLPKATDRLYVRSSGSE